MVGCKVPFIYYFSDDDDPEFFEILVAIVVFMATNIFIIVFPIALIIYSLKNK